MESTNGKQCNCPCHKTIAVLIIALGVLFLLQALNIVTAQVVAIVWPIIVIAIGLKKLFKGMCNCCKDG